jgi:hypothetical protein
MFSHSMILADGAPADPPVFVSAVPDAPRSTTEADKNDRRGAATAQPSADLWLNHAGYALTS